MSNDGTTAMSTAQNAGQEALASHLRNSISAEGTRNSFRLLFCTYPDGSQRRQPQAPILLLEARLCP
jgi:hypothetical protein